jgi:hypothetical protein
VISRSAHFRSVFHPHCRRLGRFSICVIEKRIDRHVGLTTAVYDRRYRKVTHNIVERSSI